MDAVEDVKSRLNIEDVVSEYVQLKRAGRNWKGLSPFTSERTPSFIVSPEKGIWHDFSSGKGGDIFSFIMEVEGLDFKSTLELLARRANLDLGQYQSSGSVGQSQQKERTYSVLELATKFYQTQLKTNQAALDYVLNKRQFSKETVLAFRVGYAPNNGQALLMFLKKRGYSLREAEQAGLTAKKYSGGVHDMFRGRLMIPLMDPQGRVIGFTARILEDNPDAPKYINTPQTILYDKSRHVFGLHLAKEAIRKTGFAVMVEGNLDVIGSYQAGVRQVVATAGTALTHMHLKTISRFTADVRLAFDQDRAGVAAAERAITVAGKAGISLSIITIPEGKDPDELARRDPALWRDAITHQQYALDWLVDKYQQQLDITSAQGKRAFSDVLLRVVKALPDDVEQDHYITQIAHLIGASKQALHNKLQGIESQDKTVRRAPKVKPTDAKVFDLYRVQDHLLCLLWLRPELRGSIQGLTADMFDGDIRKRVFQYLFSLVHDNEEERATKGALNQKSDYGKILLLQYDELYRDREDGDLHAELAYLRTELIKQYVKIKKQVLTEQLSAANGRETVAILEQVRQLDALLKQ